MIFSANVDSSQDQEQDQDQEQEEADIAHCHNPHFVE
jgi:hypothetical protein